MPRKSPLEAIAQAQAAPGGTAAVDRALSLLAAFAPGEASLGLPELAARTRQHKSTVLRLLASLMHGQLILRNDKGRYQLGPGIARLHAVYAGSFSMEHAVMPALRTLVATTGESAAFHVIQGKDRLCLYRVDSPHPVRDHTRAGELLPLNRGSGGHVLLAYSNAAGPLYDQIRRDGLLMISGDRVPQLAGISAPAFHAGQRLAGAVTLTMPSERLRPAHCIDVLQAASFVTRQLGGEPSTEDGRN